MNLIVVLVYVVNGINLLKNNMEEGIPLRAAFNGDVMCLRMDGSLGFDDLSDDLRELCKFDSDDMFTMKWIDEEGDPCTLSTEDELEEAKRLFHANGESQLVINIFKGVPRQPGMLLEGEDRLYRRGARRWRKIYQFQGHSFVARRFGKMTQCPICRDIIWGLGRQGVKCLNCKYMVHKRCYRFVTHNCGRPAQQTPGGIDSTDVTGYTNKLIDIERSLKKAKSVSPGSKRRGLVKDERRGLADEFYSKSKDAQAESTFHIGVNDFDFIRVIGRGSYAKVMMVRLKETERIYAMKVIKKELVMCVVPPVRTTAAGQGW